MKVLGLATSPRHGNSQALTEAVLAGAKEAGADVELIRITDLEIKPCIGCGFCKTNPLCCHKDGMQDVYSKIIEADAIVLGSPVYFSRLNAPAYALIDRLWALINPDFSLKIQKDKKFVLALTCGSCGPEILQPIADSMNTVTGFFGMKYEGYIWQNHCLMPKDIEQFPEKIEEAKTVGRKLVN